MVDNIELQRHAQIVLDKARCAAKHLAEASPDSAIVDRLNAWINQVTERSKKIKMPTRLAENIIETEIRKIQNRAQALNNQDPPEFNSDLIQDVENCLSESLATLLHGRMKSSISLRLLDQYALTLSALKRGRADIMKICEENRNRVDSNWHNDERLSRLRTRFGNTILESFQATLGAMWRAEVVNELKPIRECIRLTMESTVENVNPGNNREGGEVPSLYTPNLAAASPITGPGARVLAADDSPIMNPPIQASVVRRVAAVNSPEKSPINSKAPRRLTLKIDMEKVLLDQQIFRTFMGEDLARPLAAADQPPVNATRTVSGCLHNSIVGQNGGFTTFRPVDCSPIGGAFRELSPKKPAPKESGSTTANSDMVRPPPMFGGGVRRGGRLSVTAKVIVRPQYHGFV